MEIFKDLEIKVPRGEFTAFIRELDGIPGNWKRSTKYDIEETLGGDRQFCFEHFDNDQPVARLWLCEKDGDSLYVTNILSSVKSSLSKTEYNQYLDNFFREKLRSSRYEVVISNNTVTLDNVFSPEAKKRFLAFSDLANKSTGSSHHYDRERWFQFIIYLHKHNEVADSEYLKEFLMEDGWAEEKAFDLAIEYSFALELLKQYDRS